MTITLENLGPCCQYRLVTLELPASTVEDSVSKLTVFKQTPEVVTQSALGHFELHVVALAADVDAVGHHRHLTEQGQLVLGQEPVGFV